MHGIYRQIYERSLTEPEAFWGEAAEALHWDRKWDECSTIPRAPFYRWFSGGRLNTCFNAVDRHVEAGRGAQPAIIYDSPVTDSQAHDHLCASCRTSWRGSPVHWSSTGSGTATGSSSTCRWCPRR